MGKRLEHIAPIRTPSTLQLIAGRMGNLDLPRYYHSTVDNVDIMNRELIQRGGFPQQERMIRDKRKSLDKATLYSYQAALIRKALKVHDEDFPIVRALINPNKLKQDYDDKIVSVGYEFNFKPGDIFEWLGTNTHWLIYLQDIEELAYFRGNIRKCSYEIEWDSDEGRKRTYVAIRGPVETKIDYIQKHGISVDRPNYSLNILMPKNKDTLTAFKRYSKFYLQDVEEGDDQICWRVEATDSISTPGILEVTAVEYYANEIEDDIENGIVKGLVVPIENPNEELTEEVIVGETFIKPKKWFTYYFKGTIQSEWTIDGDYPLHYEVIENAEYPTINIYWDLGYSGQFTLTYGDFTKTIVVESLF